MTVDLQERSVAFRMKRLCTCEETRIRHPLAAKG
jgi:hypothetical protein